MDGWWNTYVYLFFISTALVDVFGIPGSLTMKHPIDHPESTQVQDVQQIRKYKSLG